MSFPFFLWTFIYKFHTFVQQIGKHGLYILKEARSLKCWIVPERKCLTLMQKILFLTYWIESSPPHAAALWSILRCPVVILTAETSSCRRSAVHRIFMMRYRGACTLHTIMQYIHRQTHYCNLSDWVGGQLASVSSPVRFVLGIVEGLAFI